MDRLRSALRGQRGLTFVELLMGMSILSVAVVTLGTVLPGIQREALKAAPVDGRAQMALHQLDQQIRWASAVFDPAASPGPLCTGCDAGYALAVYRDAESAGGARCSLWRVDGQGRLLTTSFPPGAAPISWHVVATGLVNRALSRPVFQAADVGSRTVEITLASGSRSEPTTVHAAVASRNGWTGTSGTACGFASSS